MRSTAGMCCQHPANTQYPAKQREQSQVTRSWQRLKGGDWEFILSAPREEGLNYVVKHARYNPN